jgi:hypothetical protein
MSFPAANSSAFPALQLHGTGEATPLLVQLAGQTHMDRSERKGIRMQLILLSESDTDHTFWGNSPNRCSAQEFAQKGEFNLT